MSPHFAPLELAVPRGRDWRWVGALVGRWPVLRGEKDFVSGLFGGAEAGPDPPCPGWGRLGSGVWSPPGPLSPVAEGVVWLRERKGSFVS